MEADSGVESASLRSALPTTAFENPETDPGFQQLPQRTEPRSPDQEGLRLLEGPSFPTKVLKRTMKRKQEISDMANHAYDTFKYEADELASGLSKASDVEPITLLIPHKVFYSKGTGNLSRWVKRELYRLTREAGLCWTCRSPEAAGRPFCPKHREKATKIQRAGVKRRRKAEKVAEAQKKIATPANLADAIGAFRTLQQLKRRG